MKKIVTDCDGVLLDWAFAFDTYMIEQGMKRLPNTAQYFTQSERYGIPQAEALHHVNMFNQSHCVGHIPALRDSVQWVTELARQGWRFDVISSLHMDRHAQALRKRNLLHLFGDVFDHIDCSLDFTKTKLSVLQARYQDSQLIWLEDSVTHCEAGTQAGMHSIIMDHAYNRAWQGPRVHTWKELYDTTQ
tara:strand:+ start:2146 stop:2712 length:567 start_codon:yes stop_codon:yes gene_type:complete